MKLDKIGLLLGFLLGTFAASMLAKPVRAGCVVSCWDRTCAKSYALGAVDEPYRVNHAEWTDDNRLSWDGEGVDCSGLVYKTWGMKGNTGSTALFWWFTAETLPSEKYFARNFYAGCSGACPKVCDGGVGNCPRTMTEVMDAFATLNGSSNDDDHVGLIYEEQTDSQDLILEAVDQVNTYKDVRIETHSWRANAQYRGIRRAGWSLSCSSCPDSCPVYIPLVHKAVATPYKILEYSNPYPIPGTPSPYP